MTWISATDPLALFAIQAGQVNTPARQEAAAGSSQLDTPQRAVEIGEPIPIVFARRRNGKGGVLISPGATEARFTNNAQNAVTASYHLVLSEGLIGQIPVKDVFQRSCRVGSHTQTYGQRAGSWSPGNFIVQRAGYALPECPYYCGSLGSYPRLSTLSFTSGAIPDGFDLWNRQVHCFIRNGMYVDRLADGVTGPSDSIADLVLWMLINSSRLPAELVDITALQGADAFVEAQGFTCNTWITDSRNIPDLLADWCPYFLLGETSNGGKKGLRPILPVNANGTLKTTTITPVYTFTGSDILPDSLEINYTTLADRQPFVAQMIWRQQLEDDFGIIRTADVRIDGTAEAGPYESHDLSEFCTSENHAVKAGAYIVAKRYYTTHTIRFAVKPGDHSAAVSQGDIIRVRLQRVATSFEPTYHDYLYQVERITKTLAGDVSYECTHFPVDALGRSLVALAVANATGSGINLPSVKTGISCDVNSSTNNTIPTPEFTAPPIPDFDDSIDIDDPWTNPSLDNTIPTLGGTSSGSDGTGIGGGDEVPPSGEPAGDLPITGPGSYPRVGDTLTATKPAGFDACTLDTVWYKQKGPDGPLIQISTNNAATLGSSDSGYSVIGIGRVSCPGDEPIDFLATTRPVEPALEKEYPYFRWNGETVSSWYSSATYKGVFNPVVCSTEVSPCGEGLIDWVANVTVSTGSQVVSGVIGQVGVVTLSGGSFIGFDGVSGSNIPPNSSFTISGTWQFSNNASSVDAEWEGLPI